MACGSTLIKYILFLFNFIFVLGGIALISLGVLTYTQFDKYKDLVDDLAGIGVKGPPITLMIVGSVIFIIAFLGCCGAIKESSGMMSSYATILAILLVLELAAVIVASQYTDEFETLLSNGLKKSMEDYGTSTDIGKEQTIAWDDLQERIQCCGVGGYEDWGATNFKRVPKSCCKKTEALSLPCPDTGFSLPLLPGMELLINKDGCLKGAVKEFGISRLILVGGIVAGVELLAVIFSCCLSARFRNKQYR